MSTTYTSEWKSSASSHSLELNEFSVSNIFYTYREASTWRSWAASSRASRLWLVFRHTFDWLIVCVGLWMKNSFFSLIKKSLRWTLLFTSINSFPVIIHDSSKIPKSLTNSKIKIWWGNLTQWNDSSSSSSSLMAFSLEGLKSILFKYSTEISRDFEWWLAIAWQQ